MISPVLKGIVHGLLNLLFPPQCLLCRTPLPSLAEPAEILCPGCVGRIPLNRPPFCAKCCRPLAGHPDQGMCSDCQHRTLRFDRAWSACLYEDPVPTLIHLFKYGQKTGLRKPFAGLITDFLQTYHVRWEDFDLILPIPLHPARYRERGYNQALLLAAELSGQLGIPVETKILIRRRPTGFQARRTQKERWTNISGAFKIEHSQRVRNKNILLVDDLLTTGATVSEAAGQLKSAGASRICVVTLAVAGEAASA